MAAIRTRYGKLCVDFRYLSIRCRETTALEDNAQNRKKLEKAIERMEAEILLGIFDYAKYFPKSSRLKEIKNAENRVNEISSKTPLFSKFCEIWFTDKEIEWRTSYKEKIHSWIPFIPRQSDSREKPRMPFTIKNQPDYDSTSYDTR